jgi:hypothetical protein
LGREYKPISVLKLTGDFRFSKDKLRSSQIEKLKLLKEEAKENNFI